MDGIRMRCVSLTGKRNGWKVPCKGGTRWKVEVFGVGLPGFKLAILSLAGIISLVVVHRLSHRKGIRRCNIEVERLEREQCIQEPVDPRVLDAYHRDWRVGEWNASTLRLEKDDGTLALTKPAELYESKEENKYLWTAFGAPCTEYGQRNVLFVELLNKARPRRVFEFAGNGGFLMQRALTNCTLLKSLQHWVHSEFSRPVLDFATFLVSHEEIFYSPNSNPEQAKHADWHVPLPLATSLPKAKPSVAVDIIHLDFSNADQVSKSFNMTLFDTFVTISFEHFFDDLGIICRLPTGASFLFCVPNFGGPEHFRKFESKSKIISRYEKVLDIVEIVEMQYDGRKRKFLVWGIVKPNCVHDDPS